MTMTYFKFGENAASFIKRLFVFSLMFSCSTAQQIGSSPQKHEDFQNTILQSKHHLPSNAELKIKMGAFQKRLASKKPFSSSDWALHDELLDYYNQLKLMKWGKITVPSNSSVKIRLKSFCLNGSKAAPSTNEVFEWKQGLPDIPYLKELLEKAKSYDQHDIQAIIWNLGGQTKWDDYPAKYKEILLSLIHI